MAYQAVMKRSALVRLTIVAAAGICAARAQQRLDPCAAANFNEEACRAAVQNRGYCWNGQWVRLKYRFPYPYYYDGYQEYLAAGGIIDPAQVESCGPRYIFGGGHAVSHAGFGSTGACHSAHG